MAEEIVDAVGEFEDIGRTHSGPSDLTDVLTVGYLLATYHEHPESVELNMQGVTACARMNLDQDAYEKLDQGIRRRDRGGSGSAGALNMHGA